LSAGKEYNESVPALVAGSRTQSNLKKKALDREGSKCVGGGGVIKERSENQSVQNYAGRRWPVRRARFKDKQTSTLGPKARGEEG